MTGESPLLERHDQIDVLANAASAARAGAGRFVLVVGSAGLGKTQLIAEAKRICAGAGYTVVSARGAELEREFGFGIVRQLVDPALSTLEPRLLVVAAARPGDPQASRKLLDLIGADPNTDPSTKEPCQRYDSGKARRAP